MIPHLVMLAAVIAPIWDQYPSLYCRDEIYVQCAPSGECEHGEGDASFNFDFARSRFSRPGGQSGTILNRTYPAGRDLAGIPPDTGTIFLSDGDAVRFRYVHKALKRLVPVPGERDMVDAISQSSGYGLATIRFMTCIPSQP